MSRKKAYMILTHESPDERTRCETPMNIGVEYMGDCQGIIINEDGDVLGQHYSSNYGWLRSDLRSKVCENEYDIIDYIGLNPPEEVLDLIDKVRSEK